MCTGFAWSLYFAQNADERLAAAAPGLRGSTPLRDRPPPWRWPRAAPATARTWTTWAPSPETGAWPSARSTSGRRASLSTGWSSTAGRW
eukprot:2768918-Pyramimonas_sp.AAC.1